MSCEKCNYNCDQGRRCSGRGLGGPWYGLIAAVAVTFFIGWVLAPLVAWALTGWRA